VILALGMLAHALCHPALNGVAALGRPDLCFRTGVLIFLVALPAIPFLVVQWQVTGAAWGFLASQVVAAAVWWAAFLRLVGDAPPVRETL
jgi:O-antigen/teichoic acid export membrane protein